MDKHLIFVGAGHAHVTAIAHLDRFIEDEYRVTVISSDAYHYYSGMSPGMLSGIYTPPEARFNMRQLTESRGGRFIEDQVTSVDPENRTVTLAGGRTEAYDVISFNTGSGIATGPLDTSYPNIITVKPVREMFTARCKILEALKKGPVRVVVIGGGAAGVEMAGNAWRIGHDTQKDLTITMIARGKILHNFHPKVRTKAMHSLKTRGITLEEDTPVKGNTQHKIILEDGREHPFDIALVATGVRPSPLFARSGLPVGDNGGMLVNQFLQSTAYPEIFGGGDCIHFQPRKLDKVGVYAVRQNPILLHNLHASLSGGSLKPFHPHGVYMLIINLGDGTGVYNRKYITFGGPPAFKLKNLIDKKFMKAFQQSGETEEHEDCQSWKY